MSDKLDISISELENFVQNRIWKLLVQSAIDRTNEKMTANNVIDPFKEPTQLSRNQGFIEAMEFIVDYPAILKEQVEYDQREEKKNA